MYSPRILLFQILLLAEINVSFTNGVANNPKDALEKIPCFTPKNILSYDGIKTNDLIGITYFPFESKTSSYMFSKMLRKGGIKNDEDYDNYCMYEIEAGSSVTYSAFGSSTNFFIARKVSEGKKEVVEYYKGKKIATHYTVWKSSSKSKPLNLVIGCMMGKTMSWFVESKQPYISNKDKKTILEIIKELGFNPKFAREMYSNCKNCSKEKCI